MALLTDKKDLRDEGVQRWYDSLGEKTTAETYMSVPKKFVEETGYQLSKIVRLPKLKRTEIVNEWLRERVKRQAPKGVLVYCSAIRNWLNFNKKDFDLQVEIKHTTSTPTIQEERIPTQIELRRILMHADIKTKACISLTAFAGLRFHKSASLTLSDIIELDIPTLTATEKPTLIHVPPEASKKDNRYFTFMASEGVDYFIEYLRWRRNNREELKPDSPLISGSLVNGKPICSKWISILIRNAMKPVIKARPYTLRSYFDMALLAAKVHPVWQSLFMGHKGNVESVYTTRKHLPENIIKNMREQFKPAEEYLTTMPKPSSIEEQRKRDFINVAKISGFLNEEGIRFLQEVIAKGA